jgi:lipoate-protein ligase A
MTETNREVNTEPEVLNLDLKADGTDGDEEVIPPEAKPEAKQEDQPTEPEQTESPVSSPEEKVPLQDTPAPVPGETPREKALRLEVQRLRQVNREQGVKQMVDELPKEQPIDRLEELREQGYTDEEIEKVDKLFDVMAARKGLVRAEHTYQTTVQDTLNAFIEGNPEYKPQHDADDVRWGRFQQILSSTYNIAGKTPAQLQTIFGKVKADVDMELGEPEAKVQGKRIAAQQQKVQSISHSGGTKTSTQQPKTAIDPSVKQLFKGFSDEDLQ